MIREPRVQLKILFALRIFLWIVALLLTIYWMWYSNELYRREIFDPYQYATLLRPVLYPCLGFSIIAVAVSFALYGLSRRVKNELKQKEVQELSERS